MTNYHLQAKDIMQVEVATILGDMSVSQAASLMRFEGVRSLLVEPRTPEDPYGIITYSDIVHKVLAKGYDPEKVEVHRIMTKPLISLTPDLKAEYIARLFKQSDIGHAPVIEDDQVLGIVSMTDLITEVIPEVEL
jgi:CBS domain-containing protein